MGEVIPKPSEHGASLRTNDRQTDRPTDRPTDGPTAGLWKRKKRPNQCLFFIRNTFKRAFLELSKTSSRFIFSESAFPSSTSSLQNPLGHFVSCLIAAALRICFMFHQAWIFYFPSSFQVKGRNAGSRNIGILSVRIYFLHEPLHAARLTRFHSADRALSRSSRQIGTAPSEKKKPHRKHATP